MSDKRAIIAEALLDGADVRQRLIDAGLPPSSADYELRRLDKDPYAAALATAVRRLAKRDWALQIHARLAGNTDAVPKVDRIQPEAFFRDYYAANQPVILTGLIEEWPARSGWSLDYVDDKVGDATVELQGQRLSAPDYELAKDRHKRVAKLREVTAAIRAGPSNDFYLTAYNDTVNKRALAPLYDDLGPLPILRPGGEREGYIWIGPQGTLTPFHHDLTNNLLVQVVGRKRVQMVPSWEVGRMRNAIHCFSDRSPAEWNLADPSLPPKIDCEIGPGDALFLPVGWWHHVEALDPSISVSFTSFDAPNDFYSNYPPDARF